MDKLSELSIQYLKGVGPKKAKIFNDIGINTVEDLLYYFPRRYEDRTNFATIKDLQEGGVQTIKAQILAKGQRQSFRKKGFNITEIAVSDNTGKIFCVWFNQPYLKYYFKVGTTLILFGKIERYGSRLQMVSPEFEVISGDGDESLSIGRIIPIYSLPQGLTQRTFRRFIKKSIDEYLPKINEILPFDIRSRNNFLNLAKSILQIHFPDNPDLQRQAYRRLSFEEFFLFQLVITLRKSKKSVKKGITHCVNAGLINEFVEKLPFKLTEAQKNVFNEIKTDMAMPKAMQRLLQGDVGSGKTIVAVLSALTAAQGGYQTAFMVPTEVLAKQHFDKISHQLSVIGFQNRKIRIGLLVSGLNTQEKEKAYNEIKEGKIDIVIGTHSLLEEIVRFSNLGLVIIDEQHKFGVAQRALLPKKGNNPDVLIMTATPIPRTLAITLYGDLDISVINELPAGRIPIKTMHFLEKEQYKAYDTAREQLNSGHQVYIVYPVIEESFALDIAGAKKMYDRLRLNEFREYAVGLIHGRLKQSEQDQVMSDFKNKKLNVLVTTTVLEVGIDVPEATCIIIENAQRFGLSQLHQLRGRVGRGPYQSFCILICDVQTEDAKARMAAMVKYSDGFCIAEEDLKIRGPGQFFGSRQHGLCELKIGNPLTQMQLLKKAREEAVNLIRKDPELGIRPNVLIKDKLLQRFPDYEKLAVVG